MSEHELRRRLGDVVPEAPDAPDRARAARQRATRRRQRMVATVGALAVLAAIAIPTVVVTHRAAKQVDSTGQPIEAFPCPAPAPGSSPAHSLADSGADTVERGATRARLCNPGGQPRLTWQAPADQLDEGVSQLVALVNRAPVQVLSDRQICPSNLGPTVGLLFGYPDGSTRFVTAAAYGCEGITVGGVTRGGWDSTHELVRRFVALLRAQRGDSEPTETVKVSLSCAPGLGFSLLGIDPQPELTDAILCWRRDTNSDRSVHTSRIGADDLRILLADMAAHRTSRRPEASSCLTPRLELRIVGSNAWGDRFTFFGECGKFLVANRSDGNFWEPSPVAQAILDDLVAVQDDPQALPDAEPSPGPTR